MCKSGDFGHGLILTIVERIVRVDFVARYHYCGLNSTIARDVLDPCHRSATGAFVSLIRIGANFVHEKMEEGSWGQKNALAMHRQCFAGMPDSESDSV